MSTQPELAVSVIQDDLQKPGVERPTVAPTTPAVPVNRHPTPQQMQHKQAKLAEKPQIVTELVIEEISIDGMCGVY